MIGKKKRAHAKPLLRPAPTPIADRDPDVTLSDGVHPAIGDWIKRDGPHPLAPGFRFTFVGQLKGMWREHDGRVLLYVKEKIGEPPSPGEEPVFLHYGRWARPETCKVVREPAARRFKLPAAEEESE